ncbi:hypothetical protein [Candidatus Binatus sp.]|uniref:hypothetical protein n=1 Tax=Candidatus Binatus sp. TaxID=2811406 RepID=UPI00272BDB6E|nr:hypothetical protein [Candidatus Binatus sp.]
MGIGGSVAEAKIGQKGSVEVGFVGVPPPGFQNALLNITGVRINTNASAGQGDRKWQTIPIPSGIASSGGKPGDLQIDLNTIQNIPELFNRAPVRGGNYVIAELLLDSSNPGTLIPNCPNAGANEGCINYPIQLQNAGSPITAAITSVSPQKNGLALLVLKLQLTIVQSPVVSGDPYLVNIAMSSPDPSQTLATLSGTVDTGTSTSTGKKKKIRQLAVNVQQVGTGSTIISVPVLNKCPKGGPKAPCYAIGLPAGASFGSYYDLAVAGGTATYAATRTPAITAGSTPTFNFVVKGDQKVGSISGQLRDNCTLNPLTGATLQVLIPPNSNSDADCFANPGECVVVATANSDTNGNFPLPGTVSTPSQFSSIPILSSSAPPYALMVSMPGYDSVVVPAVPDATKKGGTCTIDDGDGPCDFLLTSAIISGTVTISTPPTGETTIVQVFAEDHATNKIESALLMPLVMRGPINSAPFNLNVPTSVASFDLFATSIDTFQGVSDPYQGHTIEVVSSVPQPGPPTGVQQCKTSAPVTIGPLDCIGHGSVTGNVANADLGTSVVLSKDGVQISVTPVQNVAPNSPSTNKYSFCAPADSYVLEPFELQTPTPGTVPISAPTSAATGHTASIAIPPPPTIAASPTGSPTPSISCPSTCAHPDGSCPGVCHNVGKQLSK